MMRRLGYTDMGPQERQHQYFVSQIAELTTVHATGSATSGQSVLTFLRDWFLEHVLSQDKKFAAYVLVEEKRRRQAAHGLRTKSHEGPPAAR